MRDLHARGFEIAAHTMNHVDFALELGAETPFFSYPFGRDDQITPDNRTAVRNAGFSCCLSAYRGTVRPRDDPFDLKRIPVSPWFRSPYQYGFEAMLVRA